MGDFRIRTIFGDILHGPIHASDRDGLVIKHGRLGEVLWLTHTFIRWLARRFQWSLPMEVVLRIGWWLLGDQCRT